MWAIAGFLATTLVVVVDIIRHHNVLLTAVLAGPLIAAMGASSFAVGLLGVYAVAAALFLGETGDIFLTTDHIIRVVVVLVAASFAYLIARRRERREGELAVVRPQADDAERLRLALNAANMGTWRWDLDTGRVLKKGRIPLSRLAEPNYWLTELTLSPDGKILAGAITPDARAASSENSWIVLWDVDTLLPAPRRR